MDVLSCGPVFAENNSIGKPIKNVRNLDPESILDFGGIDDASGEYGFHLEFPRIVLSKLLYTTEKYRNPETKGIKGGKDGDIGMSNRFPFQS